MFNYYKRLLLEPPNSTKVFTRWWWYGCAVTKEEIKRELTFMQEAGIGGVEIQILYPISEDCEEKNIKNIQFFSEEFFDVMNYTVNLADSLDIKVDFTLGSGWPFGGSFISEDMAPEILITYQHDVIGPSKFTFDYTCVVAGEIYKVIIGKLNKDGSIDETTLKDITANVDDTWIFTWPWGKKLNEINVEEGHWKVYTFVLAKYKQQVGIPSVGMEGFAIDHCRKDVSDYYFKNFGDSFSKRVHHKIRAYFCDSIELSGNNWTSILIEEFNKRRGYDLTKYLPALWGSVGEITEAIRYDYYKTMSELTIENFFNNFTSWCNKKSSLSRIQAHGTWGDILMAYAAADIPEGETFGEGDKYEVNTIHRRLASSAGHIYNKPVISNESFTWLRMPRFQVTMEMIKRAADAIFLDGMNHIVNHGYSYSPEAVGEPGWTFYASSLISHTNTWWKYYKELSQYIQRVSAFMQLGYNYSQVAIYLPQGDIWSENPLAELHMAMKLEEYLGKERINHIQKKGYWFDYINDDSIQNVGETTEKGFKINNNYYRLIILINVKRMPLATLEKIREFVKQGGFLVCVDSVPFEPCGLIERNDNLHHFKEVVTCLFSDVPNIWKAVGMGMTFYTKDHESLWLNEIKKKLEPDLEIIENSEHIGYIHRTHENNHIYFLSNVSDRYRSTELIFRKNYGSFMIIDPMTLKEIEAKKISYNEEKLIVNVKFEPNQAFIIVFSPQENRKPLIYENGKKAEYTINISDNWTLEVEKLGFNTQLDKINSWENIQELKYFCGEATYSKHIDIKEEILNYNSVELEFTNIHETAEIWINNNYVGVLWKKPYKVDIKGFLKSGHNCIECRVRNLWINNYLDQNREEPINNEPLSSNWPYFSEIINKTRKRRLYSWREKEMIKDLSPSGLSGPIMLNYKKIIYRRDKS